MNRISTGRNPRKPFVSAKLYEYLRATHASTVSRRLMGCKRSEDTKRKVGAASKGRRRSADSIERGRQTYQRRLQAGEIIPTWLGKKNVLQSERMRALNLVGARNRFFGKTHSEQTRAAIGASRRGRGPCALAQLNAKIANQGNMHSATLEKRLGYYIAPYAQGKRKSPHMWAFLCSMA